MNTLAFHLIELEQRVAVLELSLQGLRVAGASNAVAVADFDAVCFSAEKLCSHLQGVRLECEYAEGRK